MSNVVMDPPAWQMCGMPLGEWLSQEAVKSARRAAERAIATDFECIKALAMETAHRDEWVCSQRHSCDLLKTSINMCPELRDLLSHARIQVTTLETMYRFSWGHAEAAA